jgi:hypothetical protein
MYDLQQCLTKPGFFVEPFKTLTNRFKSFKLTRQAVDIVRLHSCFCKLEHMYHQNVRAGIAIENAY